MLHAAGWVRGRKNMKRALKKCVLYKNCNCVGL